MAPSITTTEEKGKVDEQDQEKLEQEQATEKFFPDTSFAEINRRIVKLISVSVSIYLFTLWLNITNISIQAEYT